MNANPASWGTFSHLCPSVAHESACSTPPRGAGTNRSPQPRGRRLRPREPMPRARARARTPRRTGRTRRCSARRPGGRRRWSARVLGERRSSSGRLRPCDVLAGARRSPRCRCRGGGSPDRSCHGGAPTPAPASGRAGQAVALNVDTAVVEQALPGRCEAGHVRHLAAGNEGKRGRRRQPEKLLQPLEPQTSSTTEAAGEVAKIAAF